MLRKSLVGLVAVLLFGAAFAPPAHAQSQAVNIQIGGFIPKGIDSRVSGDVIANDLAGTSIVSGTNLSDALLFQVKDFNGFTFGGEWMIGFGDYLEGGVGVAYYKRSVDSTYANFVNTQDGSEITQTLRLRIVPVTATVRFLPLGRRSVVEPYVGGGLGVFIWRYSEAGLFIDPSNGDIFSATGASAFQATGTNVGPVLLGGVRFPVGPYDFGGEVRWQRAEGNLPSDFVGTKIDLGGITAQATFTVRFGGR
jgi:hypothetical protein